ncbi:MAG: GNAT family N-acetyltransferase [Firmicutes bacterium]|nr:GNAT family N-acetyltransferase [Bacillota bacterium]
MYVTQENLSIRSALPGDAPQLCAWWNDGKVMAHAGFPNGLGTTARRIRVSLKKDSDEACRRLIIELDGRPIGEMNYRRKDGRTAEIGIKICDFGEQDKGYGSTLLRMLIRALFGDYGYERIVLDTNVNNLRAQHVYEKLGFRRVGVRENSWRDQLGRWQSAVDYELTKENFEL